MRRYGVTLIVLAGLLSLFGIVFAQDYPQDYVLKSCGEVISISEDSITLMVNEKEASFVITEKTKIYTEDKDKITLEDIKVGEVVTVVTKLDNNTALEIEKGYIKIPIRF